MDSAVPHSETEHSAASEPGTRMSFQPIADTTGGRVHSYEAAILGGAGETIEEIWTELDPDSRRIFDQRCAAAAVRLAMAAGLGASGARLVIPSFAPSILSPAEHVDPALRAARAAGLVPERLVFAFHGYRDVPGAHLAEIVHVYNRLGPVSIFVGLGADQSGLGPCGRYQPYAVKLEPELVRGIGSSWSRRLVLEELMPRLRALNLRAIATGVDNQADFDRLAGFGIGMAQGAQVGMAAIDSLPPLSLRRAAA
jgi:EAL domain-containing protein (putative c-di-GMP-specific phosphodiesterase class I)